MVKRRKEVQIIIDNINVVMDNKNISAGKLSSDLGKSYSWWNKIQLGHCNPKIEHIFDVCDYLKVDVDKILLGIENDESWKFLMLYNSCDADIQFMIKRIMTLHQPEIADVVEIWEDE